MTRFNSPDLGRAISLYDGNRRPISGSYSTWFELNGLGQGGYYGS